MREQLAPKEAKRFSEEWFRSLDVASNERLFSARRNALSSLLNSLSLRRVVELTVTATSDGEIKTRNFLERSARGRAEMQGDEQTLFKKDDDLLTPFFFFLHALKNRQVIGTERDCAVVMSAATDMTPRPEGE